MAELANNRIKRQVSEMTPEELSDYQEQGLQPSLSTDVNQAALRTSKSDEAGAEEGMDPVDTAVAIQGLGVAPAATIMGAAGQKAKETAIDKLKQNGPPSSKPAAPLSQVSPLVRQDAIRDPAKLQLAAQNPEAAMQARKDDVASFSKGVESIKQLRAGVREKSPTSAGDVNNKYWQQTNEETTASPTSSGEGQPAYWQQNPQNMSNMSRTERNVKIQGLQNQYQAEKDPAAAKDILNQIRAVRGGQ